MKEKRYIGKNDKTGRSAKNENEKKKKNVLCFHCNRNIRDEQVLSATQMKAYKCKSIMKILVRQHFHYNSHFKCTFNIH